MTPQAKIYRSLVRKRFTDVVERPSEQIDLATAALLIAAEEDLHLKISHYLSMLDEMGREGLQRVQGSPGIAIEAFNEFFFEEKGFLGNEHQFYDPRNSFLSDVLDRRRGIPITLSIVYLEVARRASLHAEGVGMPGHFIVRARERDSVAASLVDPFYGRLIDRKDCQARLDVVFGGQVELEEEHLRPATTKEILVRLLTNLKAIYTQANLFRQALGTVDRILLLRPDLSGEHRDRGALLAQLGRLPEAISATQYYLRLSPHASDSEQVKRQLDLMHRRLAALN